MPCEDMHVCFNAMEEIPLNSTNHPPPPPWLPSLAGLKQVEVKMYSTAIGVPHMATCSKELRLEAMADR